MVIVWIGENVPGWAVDQVIGLSSSQVNVFPHNACHAGENYEIRRSYCHICMLNINGYTGDIMGGKNQQFLQSGNIKMGWN